MGSDSESDSRRSSIEEEEGAGGGMQEHDHVMSPKEEAMAHTDYEYTGPKKFIHEKIFSLPPDKWKRGFWDIHVCQTCYKQPGYYLAGCCCTCCFVYYQRKALLGDRMDSEYMCCQGAYGKCWCTSCARMCPHFCLLLESFCCTSCGVSGNRKEMMNIYPTQNTWGECCLLWTATILSFFGYFAACITILVNGCLNSQQENEWVKHEKKTGLMPYCSWGDKGAHLCNCPANKCQPCCGDPCSVGDGLYCCLCWTFGCLCSSSKLLAWGADQNCAVVNHFGAYLGAVLFILFGGGIVGALASFFPCILPIVPCAVYFPLATLNGISRHNVRSKAEVGRNQDWFGDCILANLPCTYCCSMCQMCRVVPKESWDWLAQVREHGLTMMETEFKYFPDQEVYVPGRDVEWENQPIPPLLPCLAKEEGEEDEEDDEDGEKKEKKGKKEKKEKKEVKEETREVKKDKSGSGSEASASESESESSASAKSASEKKSASGSKSGSGSGSGSGSESESAKSAKKSSSSSSSSDEGSDEGSDSGSDESESEESD